MAGPSRAGRTYVWHSLVQYKSPMNLSRPSMSAWWIFDSWGIACNLQVLFGVSV